LGGRDDGWDTGEKTELCGHAMQNCDTHCDAASFVRWITVLSVMPGFVPGIPLSRARLCLSNRDGRDIGVRKHAVLRTAMRGHDG